MGTLNEVNTTSSVTYKGVKSGLESAIVYNSLELIGKMLEEVLENDPENIDAQNKLERIGELQSNIWESLDVNNSYIN